MEDGAAMTGVVATGVQTYDTPLAVKVTLPTTGSLAVAGDTVQLFNGAGTLGSSRGVKGREGKAGSVQWQPGKQTKARTYTKTDKTRAPADQASDQVRTHHDTQTTY